MRLRTRICLALVIFSGSTAALASDSAVQLQTSVARMKSWLGTAPAAEGWRRYLWLNALETQAALGDRADLHTLHQIAQRFQADVEGLDHPAFQDVRKAIELHAQHLASVTITDLTGSLRSARDRFQTISPEEIARRRDAAIYQLELLERHYRSRFVEPERSAALNALQLSAALGDLRSIDPSQVVADGTAVSSGNAAEDQARQQSRNQSIGRLREHVQRFDENARDRFDAYFGSAMLALDRYFRTLFYASDRDLKSGFLRQLQTLEENLPLLGDPQQRRAAGLVGNALGWLDHAGQVPDLVTAVRIRFSQPNLQGQIQARFLNQLVSRNQPETRPVREVILGRLIQGTSYLNTDVSLDLLDDPNQVAVSIHALGQVHSDTYTRQGPVTAFSGSNGQFEARRQVYANIGGFYSGEPYAAANLQSEFRGTDCRLKIVNKIATKTYWKDKTLSEGIAAGRAERQIREQFGQQSSESLNGPRANLDRALTRANENARMVPDIFLNSRQDAVVVTAQRADAFRLGAPAQAPPFAVPADIQFKVHESMLSNYLDPFFASRTISSEEMARQAEKMLNEVPEAFREKSADEKWSITFAPIQAVQAQIDDGRILLAINGRRFTKADQQMRVAMIIRMAYRVTRQDSHLVLVRDGPVIVDYENPADESARTLAFKTFLTDKLNSPDQGRDGLLLPHNLIPSDRIEALQGSELVNRLQLVEFTADDGWATFGWLNPPSSAASPPNWPVHTPAIFEEGAPPPPTNPREIAPPQPDESN